MKSAFVVDAAGLYVEQYAGDVLDYGRDWSDLVPDTDAIVSSDWESVGATLSAPQLSGTVTSVFVALNEGVRAALVSNIVQTAAGRRARWEFVVRRRASPALM